MDEGFTEARLFSVLDRFEQYMQRIVVAVEHMDQVMARIELSEARAELERRGLDPDGPDATEH